MKPVLVLQNFHADSPAYLATWLQREGVSFEVRDSEAGQAFPEHLLDHSALALLGGEMSANDPLPSLRQAEALILEAMRCDKPVIGHCLGGQLMARALGARVHAAPAPEVGWQPLEVLDDPAAQRWFGPVRAARVFQWHYEAFEVPAGAQLLARSAACPHQAFAIGMHLAMQFHIEVDAAKVQRWSHDDDERYRSVLHRHPTVQDGAAMRAGLFSELAAHRALADRIYAEWLRPLRG